MNASNDVSVIEKKDNNKSLYRGRTTIGLKTTTKDKLDKNRAPGQCYDGFISQMVDFWEKANGNSAGNSKVFSKD